MVVDSRRSPIRRTRARLRAALCALLACLPLVGLTAIAGIPGCPRQVFREHERLTLSQSSAARGETVTVTATLDLEPNPAQRWLDVSASPDDTVIGDALPPPGIAIEERADLTPSPVPGYAQYRIRLRIAADAPLRPIYLRGAFTNESGGMEYHYAIQEFAITLGAGAPGVGAPVPSAGLRGTSVDVEIPATDISGDVQVDPLDDWITASNTSYDAGSGRIRTTLAIAPGARTGPARLEVVNGDGVRSVPIEFTVTAGQPVPALTGLFPNHAYAGQRIAAVLGAGSGFTAGLTAESSDTARVAAGAPVWLDSHSFTVPVDVAAQILAGTVGLTVETVGGVSGSADFRVIDDDVPAPEIVRLVPDEIATNTSALVRIEGRDLDRARPFEIVAIGSDAVELPFLGAEIVPGTQTAAGHVVARLVGMPGDPSVHGTPAGTVRLALRDADGLTTSALPLTLTSRPDAPRPVVTSVSVGRIARGGEVVETIRGERLRDVVRVFVESGGVELKRGVRIVDRPDAQEIIVTLVATDDAPLTGDEATNLVVETRGGRRSNPVAYEVTAGGGGGGDCDSTVTSGVRLVATGASGYLTVIDTAGSAIDRTTQAGEVRIDHCTPSFDCFGMYLRTGRDDLRVGAYTAVNLLFSDSAGSSWHTVDSPQVRVVAAGAHFVVFCLDNVLHGEGGNEDVRLQGHVVLTR